MIFERTRRFLGAFVLPFAACATLTISVAAQSQPNAGAVSAKEVEYSKKIQEGTDVAAKMKIAEKFIKDFPKSLVRDKFALYLSSQVSNVADAAQRATFLDTYLRLFNKPEEADLVAPARLDILVGQKQYDQAFELAESYFSRKGGDLRTRLFMAIEGANLTRTGNKKFADQSVDNIKKAVAQIESGTKPAETTDDDWKLAQNTWHAQLYQSLGFIYASTGKPAESMASFEKATQIDPKDVPSWTMYGFAINMKYQEIARQYVITEGPKQAEVRKQAEAELDKVIEVYARVAALTDGDATQAALNQQIRGDLEQYFKFRHNGSTTGLAELIAKYKK